MKITRERLRLVWNAAGANLGWSACALGAGAGLYWPGPLTVAVLLCIHMAIVKSRRSELLIALAVVPVGWIFDSALIGAGAFQAPGPAPVTGLAPFWLTAMWVNLVITMNASLRFLQGRRLAAVLLGALSGPLAYWSGARLGAIELADPLWRALISIAVAWAVATPILSEGSRWILRKTGEREGDGQ